MINHIVSAIKRVGDVEYAMADFHEDAQKYSNLFNGRPQSIHTPQRVTVYTAGGAKWK